MKKILDFFLTQIHKVVALFATLGFFLTLGSFYLRSLEKDLLSIIRRIETHQNSTLREGLHDLENTLNKEDLKPYLRELLRGKGIYSQARILSLDGKEVYRLDRKEERILETPKELLQNKSNRYYFMELLDAGNAYYISRLDWNQDFGIVEKGNLTQRVGKKFVDIDGSEKLLLINFSSAFLTNTLLEDNHLVPIFNGVEERGLLLSLLSGEIIRKVIFQNINFYYGNVRYPKSDFFIKKDLAIERNIFFSFFVFIIFLIIVSFFLTIKTYIDREEEVFFKEVYENLLEKNFTFRIENEEGIILRANAKFYEEFNLNPKEINSFYITYDHQFECVNELPPVEENITKENNWIGRVKYEGKKVLWFESIRAPIHDRKGHFFGVGILEQNITDLVLREIESEKRNQSMLATKMMANIGKMSAILSHQFSTPISVLLNNCEILEIEITRENLKNDFLFSKISQMKSTLNEMVDLTSYIKKVARVTQTGQDKTPESANLLEVVKHTEKLLRSEIQKNQVTLVYDEESLRNLNVQGSSILLSQIFINLFTNSFHAISELEEKWIRVNVRKKSNSDFIGIDIVDSGKFTKYDQHEKIFETFYSTKDLSEGSGLGLPTVREILKSYNGNIILKLNEKNTTFSITFKVAT